jgi:hypothetical protein
MRTTCKFLIKKKLKFCLLLSLILLALGAYTLCCKVIISMADYALGVEWVHVCCGHNQSEGMPAGVGGELLYFNASRAACCNSGAPGLRLRPGILKRVPYPLGLRMAVETPPL